MPGYMVHFASCNEEALLENESFRKGVEAPDILKKWVKLYGVEGAAKKYEEWREFDMPPFSRFRKRVAEKETPNGEGLHYGYSSNPDIKEFLNSLSESEKTSNPFWRGYLWHLITDKVVYEALDIDKIYSKRVVDRMLCRMSREEAMKIETKKLHDDWDRTNQKIHLEYPEIILPPEIDELGVVKFVDDGKPLTYVDWEVINKSIKFLRLFDPILNDLKILDFWFMHRNDR